MKSRPWRACIHCTPQPSGSKRACVEIAVERQLCYVASADCWRLFEPDTMLYGAAANDRVPSIGGTPHLACRKVEQWLRRVPVKGRRGHCDWNDSRQNFRRPKDVLLAAGALRVTRESRCPTSSGIPGLPRHQDCWRSSLRSRVDNPHCDEDNLKHLLPSPRKLKSKKGHRSAPYTKMPGMMTGLRYDPGNAARCTEVGILTVSRSQEIRLMEWTELEDVDGPG